jgi:hypothetical protein
MEKLFDKGERLRQSSFVAICRSLFTNSVGLRLKKSPALSCVFRHY